MALFWSLLIVAIFLPALIVGFVSFNHLVQRQFSQHREAWEKDNRPCGFMWWPEEKSSLLASQKVSYVWLFSTPQWLAEDYEALLIAKRMRRCVLIWSIGILAAGLVQLAFGPSSGRYHF